jgi:hypothetical protein
MEFKLLMSCALMQVAEELNRSARQCGEHFMGLESRSAFVLQPLWSKALQKQLFELKVLHCKGIRLPRWDVVAKELSRGLGLTLTVEDVRMQNKRLVKRLTVHGLPPGSSAKDQLAYLLKYPEVMETPEDRMRERLLDWAAERGYVVAGEAVERGAVAVGEAAERALVVASEAAALPHLRDASMPMQTFLHEGMRESCTSAEDGVPECGLHSAEGQPGMQRGTSAAPSVPPVATGVVEDLCGMAERMATFARVEAGQNAELASTRGSSSPCTVRQTASVDELASHNAILRGEAAAGGGRPNVGLSSRVQCPSHPSNNVTAVAASKGVPDAIDRDAVVPASQAVQMPSLASAPCELHGDDNGAAAERTGASGSADLAGPVSGPKPPRKPTGSCTSASQTSHPLSTEARVGGARGKGQVRDVVPERSEASSCSRPLQDMHKCGPSGLPDVLHLETDACLQQMLNAGSVSSSQARPSGRKKGGRGRAQEDQEIPQQPLAPRSMPDTAAVVQADGGPVCEGRAVSGMAQAGTLRLPSVPVSDAISARLRRRARITILRVRGQLHAFRALSKATKPATVSNRPKRRKKK